MHHNKGNGIYVFDDGRGVFEDNDVYDNDGSGVVVRSNGNPVLRRNKIHHGKKNGVYVYMDGKDQDLLLLKVDTNISHSREYPHRVDASLCLVS